MELSHRHVILAAIVAFVSWGYATHWLPSLRFLPHAFLAGIAATIAALGYVVLSTSRKRGQDGFGRGRQNRRNVAFVSPEAWSVETTALKSRSLYRRQPIYPDSFVVSDGLEELLSLVFRDFVNSWYKAISSRPTFTNEVDRAVRTALTNILEEVTKLDVVELMVSRIVPIITKHLKDCYEAEKAVRGKKLSRNVTESEELDLAIAGKYRDGQLHPAASLAFSDTKLVQQQHLRGIVVKLLPKVLPPNMTTSPSVTVIIKEIVSCAVLFPVLQILTDPDTWNQLLEGYGRSLLQERKTVRKLRAALDEGVPTSPNLPRATTFPKLSPNDNERKFERFIRAIKHCNTLSDARRFRSEVASQLRKETAVEGQDPTYIKRLETGKRILDQRISYLGAGGSTSTKPKLSVKPLVQNVRVVPRLDNAPLKDILYNASCLSYFMEFMDRLNLMRLVQFWIVVDGFRNPLEDDTDVPVELSTTAASWTESDRADLAQINEAYLSQPEVPISTASRDAVRQFLKAGNKATPHQYLAARAAVLRTQTAVYEKMSDPHYQNFKKSDLWFKLLASEEANAARPASPLATTENRSPLSRSSSARPPPKLPRLPASNIKARHPDLRRAVVSSSDLKGITTSDGRDSSPRRSLDDSARAPLFEDDYDTDHMSRSIQSLDSDTEPSIVISDNTVVVDAMQAALNDIMEEQPDQDSIFSEPTPSLTSPHDGDLLRASQELPRSASPALRRDNNREKPSIASLGLLGTPGRRGFFEEDLFGDEQAKFLEDEREDSDVNEKSADDEIHEAAPGDLGLAEAIDALTLDIEKLVTQESIVDSLNKKAELTNNAAELRILRKSKASLQREINRKELQRQQYIIQESDNSLFGKATVSIQSIMVGTEDDGKEYALYIIEVRRQAGDQMPAAAWAIARRYSEFHELNKRLRSKYPQVRNLEFPRRQVVFKLQRDFLEKRRIALEKYLRQLLLIPAICRSREFRAFLSQQTISATNPSNTQADTRDFVTRIYNSVTDGMEDFLGNIPVLDQLSLAGQNLISAATTQLASSNNANTVPTDDLTTTAEAEAELRAFDPAAASLEPFVKPICDLFLELFELNRESNWLRGRAVVVVLHQLLGGTIERKVRETAKTYLHEDNIAKYIDVVKETMWPGGQVRPPGATRTPVDRLKSRKEAEILLAMLVPDLVGSVVGRANAKIASKRILATIGNRRLNTHLIFTLLDEIVQIVFGDTLFR